MSSLSTELFAAARDDAPSDALRDAMWDRIADATGAAATAAGAQAATTTAKTFGAAKLLAIGGVIGAVSTALGVVVTVAMVEPSGSSAAPASRIPVAVARGPRGGGPSLFTSPTLRKGPGARDQAEGTGQGIKVVEKREDDVSDLAEEARLVTAARAALVAGDPSRALALVRATRSLSTRALEPEELGLEARALSALGRADEAAATDLLLRRRYPDSALAR